MRRHRILIADDNKDTVESFAALLTLEGHEVVCASNGAQALELFDEMQPDTVLLDISMPVLDGREVARRIRAWESRVRSGHVRDSKRRVLLVAVSGWTRDSDVAQSLESGFDHYFIKPVEFRAVSRLL